MAKIIITEFEFSEVKLGQNSSASRSYPKQSKVSDLLKLLQFASKIASNFFAQFSDQLFELCLKRVENM